jgi:hypothetical protein
MYDANQELGPRLLPVRAYVIKALPFAVAGYVKEIPEIGSENK